MALTKVVNIVNNRAIDYHLPPEKAVVAAFEEFEHGNMSFIIHLDPEKHPEFRSYRRSFACGDWMALKPAARVSRVDERNPD